MSRRLTEEEENDWQEEARAAKKLRDQKAKEKKLAAPMVRHPAVPPATPAPKPPTKKTVPAAPLVPLPKREAARLFKSRGHIEATLDLHGMTQEEAHEALRRFVHRARSAGKRHIAIITGKGRTGEGVLRRAVPRWLELADLRPDIAAITHAAPEKGGDGVLHVLLKKL